MKNLVTVTSTSARDDGLSPSWEITVTRHSSYLMAPTATAADLPDDIRAGLLAWLGVKAFDAAEAEALKREIAMMSRKDLQDAVLGLTLSIQRSATVDATVSGNEE